MEEKMQFCLFCFECQFEANDCDGIKWNGDEIKLNRFYSTSNQSYGRTGAIVCMYYRISSNFPFNSFIEIKRRRKQKCCGFCFLQLQIR